MLLHAGWRHVIQQAHPKLLTFAYSDTEFSKLTKVEIVACNGAVPALRAEPLHLGSLYVFDTIFRPKGTWKQHWIPKNFAANHAKVSGVTDFVGKCLMLIHNTSKQWFSFDGLNAIQHPNAPLSSILDCTAKGGVQVANPQLVRLTSLHVTTLGKNVFHPDGLLPLGVNITTRSNTQCVQSYQMGSTLFGF